MGTGFVLVLCGVGHIVLFVFWKTTNRAQIIVFERFGGPEKCL